MTPIDLLVREPRALASEDGRDRARRRTPDELAGRFPRTEPLPFEASGPRRRRHRPSTVAQRFGELVDDPCPIQDLVCPGRPFGGLGARKPPRAHEPEVPEAHGAHGAGGRADVARVSGRDQDDPHVREHVRRHGHAIAHRVRTPARAGPQAADER